MKLAIDASRANAIQKTGVESYAYHVIQELKKITPSDVEVVLYSRETLQGDLAELPKNWSSIVLRWPPKRLWTQLRLSLEMLLHKPDVLFVPAHVVPIVHPKKTVMTVHDVAALKYPETYNRFERWYSLHSAKQAAQKLWKIITISEFTKSEIHHFVKDVKAKIEVIPLACDDSFKVIEDEEIIEAVKQKYNITKPFILSVSRLEHKKNTHRIVQAFDILKETQNIQLVLVGKPGHGYEHVLRALDASPNKKDIILPGWVDEVDIVPLMNAAKVFAFPSLYEGFGIPLLESFACSTPVVASSGTSLEEVGGNAALYADPKNVEDIAEKITTLLTDQNICSDLQAAGLERSKDFSWNECSKATLETLLSE